MPSKRFNITRPVGSSFNLAPAPVVKFGVFYQIVSPRTGYDGIIITPFYGNNYVAIWSPSHRSRYLPWHPTWSQHANFEVQRISPNERFVFTTESTTTETDILMIDLKIGQIGTISSGSMYNNTVVVRIYGDRFLALNNTSSATGFYTCWDYSGHNTLRVTPFTSKQKISVSSK